MSTNHEDYIKKRDEALDKIYSHTPVGDLDPSDDGDRSLMFQIDKSFSEAAQAIDALVLEVIGEDGTSRWVRTQDENDLRAKQRKIVTGETL